MDLTSNLFDQVANISKAHAYDTIIPEYKRLQESNAELLEALKDLVNAHETGMGKSAVALRVELAKDVIKKAK